MVKMELDYIMKLGGSLLTDLDKTKILLSRIQNSRNRNVAYTVGSGYMGDVYNSWIKDENHLTIPFEKSIKIWSDIQSINANLLASLNSNFVVCNNQDEMNRAIAENKRPILDAVGFHQNFKCLQYQTTDVRTAYLCHKLGCQNLIIVTDVDGIYEDDPKNNSEARKIRQIKAQNLKDMGRTSVDQGLADMLIEYGINAYVVGIDGLVAGKDLSKESMEEHGTVIEH